MAQSPVSAEREQRALLIARRGPHLHGVLRRVCSKLEFDGIEVFVFDWRTIGRDGLCYAGIDFDACIEDRKLQPLAKSRIKALKTYHRTLGQRHWGSLYYPCKTANCEI